MTAASIARTSSLSRADAPRATPVLEPASPKFLSGRPCERQVCYEGMQASVTSTSTSTPEPPVHSRELSRRIKDQALREGFEMVGIVAATALNDERKRL